MLFLLVCFIVYINNEADPGRKQIHILSNLLCHCAVHCKIDQYYHNIAIPDWDQWISNQLQCCISLKGYILLECSQSMYNLLENMKVNNRIEMADAHVYSFTLRHILRTHTDRFIPFYIDDATSDYTPTCLASKTIYRLPISELPQDFVSEILEQKSVSNFQILEDSRFRSLRSLIATLTGQHEIPQPLIGKTCKNHHIQKFIIHRLMCCR